MLSKWIKKQKILSCEVFFLNSMNSGNASERRDNTFGFSPLFDNSSNFLYNYSLSKLTNLDFVLKKNPCSYDFLQSFHTKQQSFQYILKKINYKCLSCLSLEIFCKNKKKTSKNDCVFLFSRPDMKATTY